MVKTSSLSFSQLLINSDNACYNFAQIKQLDWVERAWPKELREQAPRKGIFLTVSFAGFRSDVRPEKGGASAWIHVIHGNVVRIRIYGIDQTKVPSCLDPVDLFSSCCYVDLLRYYYR